MEDFLDRCWFARLWTSDDVVVAIRCHIVCGKFVILQNDMCAGVRALQFGRYSRLLGFKDASILLRHGERLHWQPGNRSSLQELLVRTRALQSREAQDKVFRLMSLLKQSTATGLQIEYGQPVPDLFSKVAHACIAEDKSLAILAEVELRSRRISEILFSGPDWRFQSPTLRTFDARRPNKKLFQSTRKTEPLVTSCSSFDTLAVRGFLIALYSRNLRMKTTLNLRDNAIKNRNLDASRWTHQDWDGIYRRAALHLDLPVSVVRRAEQGDILMLSKPIKASYEPLGYDQMLHLSLRRTVTGEVSPRLEGRLPPASAAYHLPACTAWEQRRFNESPPPQVLWEHDEAVGRTMRHRRDFIIGSNDDA